MNLGIFLAIGESWEEFVEKGQDDLLLSNNYAEYAKVFDHVWVFSYGRFNTQLNSKVTVLGNRWGLNRYLYSFLLPILHRSTIRSTSVLRGMQLTGGIPALMSKCLYGKKVLINYGYEYAKVAEVEGKRIQALVFPWLEKLILPRMDAVVVTTPSLQQKLVIKKVAHPYLIPNSVDTDLFRPTNVKKTISILFVGRLTQQKNLELLLRSVQKIPMKNLKLTFIGSGSEREKLQLMAKKAGIDLRILMNIPHKNLVSYYNKAKVFVLPSRIEGHPKVLLEAMSCGLAVVGADVEGIRGLIVHAKNGLLVEPNEGLLAIALNELLTSRKLRQNLGASARRIVREKFDRTHTWKKELELLKQLIN